MPFFDPTSVFDLYVFTIKNTLNEDKHNQKQNFCITTIINKNYRDDKKLL